MPRCSDSPMKSVLSVQSHVVHGYVGGRAATFPLQCLGWDVDNVNTVNFSNHTGYGSVKGSSLVASDMRALFRGLGDIDCHYDAVISGYIPSAELIDVLAENVARMKLNNPDLLYVCDTVMGDEGHLYVDTLCVDAYRRLLAAVAVDVITPNQFELELLCGFPVDSAAALRQALAYIHDTYGVRHVVVTSLSGSVLPAKGHHSIFCAVSSDSLVSMFSIPKIELYFTGVGDLFTALLLDKFHRNPQDLPRAVNQVLTIMSDVLKLTTRLGIEDYCLHKKLAVPPPGEQWHSKMNDASMRFFELRIIQAKQYYDYDGEGLLEPFAL